MGWDWALSFGVASLLLACEAPPVMRVTGSGSTSVATPGRTTLVLIHTADLHSHVFPELTLIGEADAQRGLGRSGEVSAIGGFSRVATLVHNARQNQAHCLYLDSGDLIEGSAAFTAFGGEPELRALSALHVDAVALGNHDLDPGAADFVTKHRQFAAFPVLAANVGAPGSAFGQTVSRSVIVDAGGLRVGVIGVANPNSPPGLSKPDNPYGIVLEASASAVQSAIDTLRPSVDLIVAVSHLGLDGDEALILATTGLDVVLGGHQHLTIEEPLARLDCGPAAMARRGCRQHRVFLVHSGALARYVGRVELALEPAADGSARARAGALEVMSAEHTLSPASADVPADPALDALLEPYRERLAESGFDTPRAFALGPLERNAVSGGDSALGNLIADAIRDFASADFAVLNSTGVRADLPPGELTQSAFVAALPFADTLTRLSLTGAQLTEVLNEQARIAESRGCRTPVQISGFTLTFECRTTGASATIEPGASDQSLDPAAIYTLVTTDYVADGGSGFQSLSKAGLREELEVAPLEVVLDAVGRLSGCAAAALPCLDPVVWRDGRIRLHSE